MICWRSSRFRLAILALVLAAGVTTGQPLLARSQATPATTAEALGPPAGYDAATRDDAAFNRTFRHEFAPVNGILMHYVVGGEGPPLVLLHGWPQTWYEWIEVMPALAADYTVIAVDLPGLGDSVGSPPSYDKRTLAQYLHGLVSGHLGLDPVGLVGHDLGAGVAYQYAVQFPDEVSRLALLDYPLPGPASPPGGALSFVWHFGFHAARDGLAAMLVDDEVLPYLDWFFDEQAFAPNPLSDAAVAEFARTYAQPDKLAGGFDLYRTLPQDEQDNRASAATPLPMPVLVVTGQRDGSPYFDRLDVVLGTVLAVAQDVEGVDVAGAEHWLAEEQPEALTALLLAFFAEKADG